MGPAHPHPDGKRLLRRRAAIRITAEATLTRPFRADVTVRRTQTLR